MVETVRKLVLGSILFAIIALLGLSFNVTCSFAFDKKDDGMTSLHALVNGDFENGTLNGWDVNGLFTINVTVVHNGSYSAYAPEITYGAFLPTDRMISQVIYPRIRVSIDSFLTLEA